MCSILINSGRINIPRPNPCKKCQVWPCQCSSPPSPTLYQRTIAGDVQFSPPRIFDPAKKTSVPAGTLGRASPPPIPQQHPYPNILFQPDTSLTPPSLPPQAELAKSSATASPMPGAAAAYPGIGFFPNVASTPPLNYNEIALRMNTTDFYFLEAWHKILSDLNQWVDNLQQHNDQFRLNNVFITSEHRFMAFLNYYNDSQRVLKQNEKELFINCVFTIINLLEKLSVTIKVTQGGTPYLINVSARHHTIFQTLLAKLSRPDYKADYQELLDMLKRMPDPKTRSWRSYLFG